MIRIEDIKWSIDEDEKEALANLPVNVTITGNDEKRIRIDSEGDETELLDLIFNWLHPHLWQDVCWLHLCGRVLHVLLSVFYSD